MRQSVWLGSVVAAFLVGSMASTHSAQGEALSLDGRVAALEAWRASSGVFTQDTLAPGRPWVFAPANGGILLRSVNTDGNGGTPRSGRVTIASGTQGAPNESYVMIDTVQGMEKITVKAAKDLVTTVGNDQIWKVVRDDHFTAGNDAYRSVTQTEHTSLGSADWKVNTTSKWATAQSLDIEGGTTAQLAGVASTTVKGQILLLNGGRYPVQTSNGPSATVLSQ